MTTNSKATMATPSMRLNRSSNARMIQNFHLVWLHGSVDEVNDDDCRNSMMKLREVVNNVSIFSDVDECIDFITDMEEEKTFMIISEEFSEMIIPFVQDISQVTSVHIFCRNNTEHAESVKKWSKINGVYSYIEPICEALKQTAQDYDHNSVSISFVKTTDGTSNQSLDTLDQSFMNTQILKDILLTIDFQNEHINDFLKYCREQFVGNPKELKNVDKIEKEYYHHPPIWWYTYNCFLYSMLNRALRLMEVDLIVKVGFFIQDLHNHIAKLHSEQYDRQNHSESFTIYRGQGLSQTDFHQLKNTQGGLLAFNNFLSTSQNRDVSLRFVRRTITSSNLVGVLFILRIDPSISPTPFANVKNVSSYQGEEEILFSMHSIFRIGSVKQIDKNDRLWQVELTLTSDNDQQLHSLTQRIREETNGLTGWHRLGKLMIALGQFDKAEILYEVLLKQAGDGTEKATIFHYLGQITEQQGKYEKAITIYEKGLEIMQKTLPENHSDLGASYNNIGSVYEKMGEYSKALSYYEKGLEIGQRVLPANHSDLGASYNNIGSVYDNMGEYSKALSYYERALGIGQKTLPANHPSLAASYNNIGSVYDNMGEYSKALSYYEKALEIRQKTLPENHPHLATTYNNIGGVYYKMNEFSEALLYCEHALNIFQRSLPSNHPNLQAVRENIEIIKKKL